MNCPTAASRILHCVHLFDQVWQYIGSTCIKHMQKNSYTEVTGIIHIPEKRVFMSVGWDRKITAFKDDPDVSSIMAFPNKGFTF